MQIGVDGNNMAHKQFYLLKHELGEEPQLERTDIRDRLIERVYYDLLKVKKYFSNQAHLKVAFDHKVSFRKLIYPAYKANRKEKTLGFQTLMAELPTLLSQLGIEVSVCEGLEADDVLAAWAELKAPDQFLVLVSADEDIRQLVRDKIAVYTNNSLHHALFATTNNLIGDYPWQLLSARAAHIIKWEKQLIGCNTDNVPRSLIKGIGPKKLTPLFDFLINQPHNALPSGDFLVDLPLFSKIDSKKKLIDEAQYEINKRLVWLDGASKRVKKLDDIVFI